MVIKILIMPFPAVADKVPCAILNFLSVEHCEHV